MVTALLFHQVNRLWEYGFSGVGHHYAPVFGVRLPRRSAIAGQLAALPLALPIALTAPSLGGRTAVVALISFWMLATHMRLSDHCWLGAVAVAAMAFTPAQLHPAISQDLLAGVYLTAALLKVNDEYLFSERSAGRVVTAHYFRLLGMPVSPRLLKAVPVVVIAAELATGVLVCIPGAESWALWLAILMHLAFGVSGNFPFSVVALVLWVTVLSPSGQIEVTGGPMALLGAAVLVGLLALVGGRTAVGRRPAGWLLKDFYQGAAYGCLCAMAVLSPAVGVAAPVDGWGWLTHALIAVAFVVNFLLVVAGVKLEWSFAMFTSLRPFGRSWLERHQVRNGPRYYALTLPPRIPRSLLGEVDPTFVYLATRDENVVHEGVVYHLEAVARRHHVTFAPQVMCISSEDRVLVPAAPSQPAPRRRFLDYPAVVPRSLDRRYLA
ncbi:hypothetical protein [Streptomyces erythrochromogenes]|uniref:hypothetical protein n=1 Tax=Streptomyces erythrochromogenes TaxID=285574 RepID=UPI00369DA797